MPAVVNHRVLLVEDEPDIANVVQLHINDLGATVTHAVDGVSGLAKAAQGNWSLILLDLNLPGLDGLAICEQVRDLNPYVPIVILSARANEQDVVKGLQYGADHYICKPFSVQELIAQVGAIFRRAELDRPVVASSPDLEHYVVGDLTIIPQSHKVQIGSSEVSLTAREFDLLLHFVKHPGAVFSRQQLLEEVWGYTHTGYMHTVNSHINRLRAKIEPNASQPTYIETVWGVGYRLKC